MPHYVGLNSAGYEMFTAASGDSTTTDINSAGNFYTNAAPNFTYGFNSNFTYKNWGFSFFLRGVAGAKIFDNTRMVMANINRFAGNNALVESLTSGMTQGPIASDHWLENASFMRMDNINLSYTLHNLKAVQSLKIYLAANNVFVITPYKGLDPEIDVQGSNAYIDVFSGAAGQAAIGYPKSRSYSLGVNVTFK
jgi:iron complex outermembrane receptor protein